MTTTPPNMPPPPPGHFPPSGPGRYPAPGFYPGTKNASARTNVMGIISLVLLGLYLLKAATMPFIYASSTASLDFSMYTTVAVVDFIVSLLLAIGAIVVGSIGAANKAATKLHWAAIGGLVTGVFIILSETISFISGFISAF